MRRCEDQRLYRAQRGINAREKRQKVGERLARPRRRLADQILSRIRSGNQSRLYLRRHSDAAFCESHRKNLRNTERCKCRHIILLRNHLKKSASISACSSAVGV